MDNESLVIEVGDGSLRLSGCGQFLDPLYEDPLVKKNSPRFLSYKKTGFDISYLIQYEGTDLVQWHGRVQSGFLHPWGPIMLLTPAGKESVRRYRRNYRAMLRRSWKKREKTS